MSGKPHILVLHGALGSVQQLEPLTSTLSTSFEVHSFNFSGHGGQPFREHFSLHQFSEELGAFIDKNSLSGINVFGYSMGGYVALMQARQQPSKLGKIVTLGTKFHWTPASAAKEVKMLNPVTIEEKVPALARMLEKHHAPIRWKALLKKTEIMMLELGQGKNYSPEDFATIDHEVMITVGDQDTMVSIEESENVASALPNGSFNVFPGFKHPIEQVDYKVLTASLKKFFLH